MQGEETSGIPERGGGGLFGWAARALIGAVLAAAIGAYYNQRTDQARFEKEEQLKREELTAQQQLSQQKIRTQHEEFVLKNLDSHNEANGRLARELAGQYYSLEFRNTCDKQLTLAIRYAGLDGAIYVRGWYSLKSQELRGVGARTQSSWFDFYAYNSDGKVPGGRTVTVANDKFEYIDDQYFQAGWLALEHADRAEFKEININQPNYGTFTYDLPCPPVRPLFERFPKPSKPSGFDQFFLPKKN
jgi:type II secretory pathway pseudopilin PulG